MGGPSGTGCPVSSSNSRRATSTGCSPGSISPFGIDQWPWSFRVNSGPPGCASSTSIPVGARRYSRIPALRRSAIRPTRPRPTSLVVDLGALQSAAEVDVDRLPFGVRVERDLARLAVTVARLLPAPERQVDLGAGRAGVDVDDAGLEVAHGAERGVHVAREDARRQPVAGLVERGHRLRVVGDRDDREDRPEDLFLADAVHRPDTGEDRRFEEMAVAEGAIGRAVAAEDELALRSTDIDVRRDLVDRRRVDQRPDVGRRIEAVAEPQPLGALLEALQQLVDDGAFDDDARCSRAALAGCPEGAPQDPVGREIEIGVREDDDAVLATELQRQPLQALAGADRDRLAGDRRPRERDDR